MEENLQPELKDIIDSLHRYLAVRGNKAAFVLSFVGFKDGKEKCIDCGEPVEEIDDSGSGIFAYGDLETLRTMSNETRDMIEDECDEDGFVNI